MTEWAEQKNMRLAGHITVGVVALVLLLWIINVFAVSSPILSDAAVGHDTAWIIVAILLALLLIGLEIAILWPEAVQEDFEFAEAESEWSDDAWEDDGWTDESWEEEVAPEPVFGTVEEVQRHARQGDKMLGCPDCGTVFLKRAHEIDEEHERDFPCPNCGTGGHFEPGAHQVTAQVIEHTCTSCGYDYEAYQEHHKCPSCHAEQ